MQDLGESAALEAYANGLKAAFDDALQDAERAGRTEGREGSVAKFQKFEQVAKSQQARLARLQAQASGIESQLRSGSIQLDRALLQRATPQERTEFQNSLTPGGRNWIQEIHPNLFPRTSLGFPKYAGQVIPAIPLASQSATNPGKSRAEKCMNLIANLIVTPAEAAVAVPCVASCLAQAWPICVSCVVAAGPVAVADYNAMVSCWNGSGKPWWMPSWVWKIKCVAVLAGQLA
jgi:hypothetical protein